MLALLSVTFVDFSLSFSNKIQPFIIKSEIRRLHGDGDTSIVSFRFKFEFGYHIENNLFRNPEHRSETIIPEEPRELIK